MTEGLSRAESDDNAGQSVPTENGEGKADNNLPLKDDIEGYREMIRRASQVPIESFPGAENDGNTDEGETEGFSPTQYNSLEEYWADVGPILGGQPKNVDNPDHKPSKKSESTEG